MSIPLDRLYHYLESLSKSNIIIYRWYPHGSKKLRDLEVIESSRLPEDYFDKLQLPCMICHDQEPLDYNYYTHEEFLELAQESADKRKTTLPAVPWCYSEEFLHLYASSHLRVRLDLPTNLNDFILLCHSEKNSDQLKLYEQNGFVGVYYWSHAIIAKDWFRYAEHDPLLTVNFDSITTDFLIYNRAWIGTREYRLKFAELLIQKNLVRSSNVKFSPFDSGIHYTDHKFKNNKLSITTDIESNIVANTSSSSASADYDNNDYSTAAIEVVLETLFDDTRHHLTEKALRPIACGRPFILVAAPNILEYLKMYGFKTFNGLIDESYDSILDPLARLDAITNEMQRIASLAATEKQKLFKELYKISEFNKQHFFSNEFDKLIVDEFTTNLDAGLEKCRTNMTGKWWMLFTRAEMFEWETPVTELYKKIDNWLAEYNTEN